MAISKDGPPKGDGQTGSRDRERQVNRIPAPVTPDKHRRYHIFKNLQTALHRFDPTPTIAERRRTRKPLTADQHYARSNIAFVLTATSALVSFLEPVAGLGGAIVGLTALNRELRATDKIKQKSKA